MRASNMKRKIISSMLVVCMVFGISYTAIATPLSDAQQQELNESQQKFNEINDKIRGLESKIDGLTDQMEPIFFEIEENNKEIEETKKEISEVELQIEEKKSDIEKQQEVLGGRIRATYKNGGQSNYISVLLSSTSIGDLLSKVQAINKIMSIDRELIDQLNETKKELDEKVSTLENKTKELTDLNTVNQQKIDDLNKKKAEQQVVIDEMKVEKSKIISQLTPLERELAKPYISKINSNSSIDELNNAINALRGLRNQIETSTVDKEIVNAIEKGKEIVAKKKKEQESANNPNRGEVVTGNASSLISYAYQFIGKPYIFGATGPNSFDCSGFTQYVFRKFGYNLTRTTYTQVKQGTYVSRDQLQPGDLVFTRGSASRPEHVGIYVGNGQMIHASRPGVGVIVGGIYDYVTARRIM